MKTYQINAVFDRFTGFYGWVVVVYPTENFTVRTLMEGASWKQCVEFARQQIAQFERIYGKNV